MSFVDAIVTVGSSVYDWATGNSTSAGLARNAALAFAVNQVSNMTSSSTPSSQQGTQVSVSPDVNNSIPVIYGKTMTKGMITDAVLASGNMTMWYCLTLCEVTGDLLSTSNPSEIKLNKVYWNQLEVIFKADGVTIDKLKDGAGNYNTDISGLVQIYYFKNGSTNPAAITGLTASTKPAYSLMPGWGSSHAMTNLSFVLIKINYSTEKSITGIGDLDFQIENTMKKPGDCLFDYLTNNVYGAGFSESEVMI
jgi:hypothetical protein